MTAAKPTFSLVLGSGGMAGGAFHAGVLKALHDIWHLDARDAKTVVGTSAGALTGSLIAAGLSADDVFRRETGKLLSPEGAGLLNAARSTIGKRHRPSAGFGGPAAPEVLTHFAFRPWSIPPGTVAAALLPRGRVPTDAMASLVKGLHGTTWPTRPRLEVVTVSLSDGSRRVFTSDSDVPLDQAVAASCSVPGVYQPVQINGVDYLDGGVHSSDNVDVLRDDVDLVIVSSPMSAERYLDRPSPWSPFRAMTRMQTDQETRRVPGSPRVCVLRPTADDLDAMGPNLLDPQRRPTVAMQAYSSASDRFRELALASADGPPENGNSPEATSCDN